jgi:hypothetical protein
MGLIAKDYLPRQIRVTDRFREEKLAYEASQ